MGIRRRVAGRLAVVALAVVVAVGAVGCSGGSSGSGASGGSTTPTVGPTDPTTTSTPGKETVAVVVTCGTTDLSNLTCANDGLVGITTKAGPLELVLHAGTGHCAPVAYAVSVDDGPAVETELTTYVGDDGKLPESVKVDLGRVDEGAHVLRIGGTKGPEGCGTDQWFGSFGVDVELPAGAAVDPAFTCPTTGSGGCQVPTT